MNRRVFCGTILLAFSTLITGCATGQEWAAWKQHPAHRVTRADITTARSESWWGTPITVNSHQIQQN
jgi:hypothetical protein